MTSNDQPLFTILLAEDDENDVVLIQRALQKSFTNTPVYVVRNGQEAIDYLSGTGEYADRTKYPFPELVITDLKMPKLSGFEFLQWVKLHPDMRVIPTIVLSSSNQEMDVVRAYDLGANTFMVKPSDFNALGQMVKLIKEYWSVSLKPKLKS